MDNHNKIQNLINKQFPKHPFSSGIDEQNVEILLSNYLGLCQCAPYIIGGSNKELFLNAIFANRSIDKNIEITTAVSSFLSFDESGNYNRLKEIGDNMLLEITDTSDFHYNMLKNDLRLLFNKNIEPIVIEELKQYFVKLGKGLSTLNDIERCACLVALEVHSEIMISALWKSVLKLFPKYTGMDLTYFHLHVGGYNPAEKYHVAMTESMINKIVPKDKYNTFQEYFIHFYTLNSNLCSHFIETANKPFYEPQSH